MNKDKSRKYLLLIPLVLSLLMLKFFAAAHDEIVRVRHEQKLDSVQIILDLAVSQIDRFVAEDDDWATYDYLSVFLKPMIEEIDELTMIYAELFDSDLNPLTQRHVEGAQKPFNLLEYPECVQSLKGNDDKGKILVEFDDDVHLPYDMHLSFGKFPSGDYTNKYIAVIGLGVHAIENNLAPWLVWGVIGMISVTVVLQLWMIFYIAKLSDAEQRTRQKSRKEGIK